jgi:hypothetical protein
MKYFIDKILYKLQDKKWFWKYGLGNRLVKARGIYAVQFAKSSAFSIGGYSTSGNVNILKDHYFLTYKLAEKVYEECIDKWQKADRKNGYIHDDDLVLWEYNNGYTKELRNYQEEVN